MTANRFDACLTMLRRVMRGFGLPAMGMILSLSALAQSSPPISLHYIQRPPYMVSSQDMLAGLTGAPTYLAFKEARIPFVLRETPFARQLHMVETNSGQDCMIGMFKKPERELFAKFSKPVYQDQAQVILTAAENAPRFANYKSITELLDDKSMRLLAKLGYSYGVGLDALMERHSPNVTRTADENLLMIKAIKLKMNDYMFIAPEEAAVAIEAAGFADTDFKQIKLKNMPPGEYRRVMCSKSVPDEVINKLNAVIRFDR